MRKFGVGSKDSNLYNSNLKSYSQLCLDYNRSLSSMVSLSVVIPRLEADDPSWTYPQVNSELILPQHLHHSPCFILSRRPLLYHSPSSQDKGEYSTITNFEGERQIAYHITFITVLLHLFILSLAIVVNLLLCLAYKLNFIKGTYMYRRKKIVYIGFSVTPSFRHPLGGLETYPHR